MTPKAQRFAGVALLAAMVAAAGGGGVAAQDEAVKYVAFVEDLSGNCAQRQGKLVLVRSMHPSRTVRVWLDRYHMGTGTGDRSKSDLSPGGEPEPLGCSRTTDGPQEWRLVRAAFVD